MRISFTNPFQRDFKKLNAWGRSRIYRILTELPSLLGRTHLHTGLGIRKLHPSGIFEVRIGLGLRMVFGLEKDKLICHRIGDHDTIRQFLKNL